MGRILSKSFFDRDTKTVARELLGKFLVRKIGKKEIAGMITETEAYDGLQDKASHASKGRTKRTEIMFGHAGNFYVYLVYGMNYMLKVVTREHGYPAAVLIRGIANANGPGKVTRFFHINKAFNQKPASASTGLWFEDRGEALLKSKVKKLSRVGVAYAGPVWSAKKWRFTIKP